MKSATSQRSLYIDPRNCLPRRSPELLSTLFGTPVGSNCSHETNCAVKELALPHGSDLGRKGCHSRRGEKFQILPRFACLRHRKWWKSRWKKALCLGFSCLSFYSQMPGSAPTTATTCCLFPTQANPACTTTFWAANFSIAQWEPARQPWTPLNHNCTLCWAQFVPASLRSAERMWTGHFVAVDSSMAVYGSGDRNSVFPLGSFLRPVWPFPAKLSGYRYARYVLLFISMLSCFLARDAFFVFADACKPFRCFCLSVHAVWTPEGMKTLFPIFENSLFWKTRVSCGKHCELFVFCVKQWLQSASTEARSVGALCV